MSVIGWSERWWIAYRNRRNSVYVVAQVSGRAIKIWQTKSSLSIGVMRWQSLTTLAHNAESCFALSNPTTTFLIDLCAKTKSTENCAKLSPIELALWETNLTFSASCMFFLQALPVIWINPCASTERIVFARNLCLWLFVVVDELFVKIFTGTFIRCAFSIDITFCRDDLV